jgi:hypothetical protein
VATEGAESLRPTRFFRVVATGTGVKRSDSSKLAPYERLAEEMQRIHRIGGKIVNVTPVDSEGAVSSSSEKEG